MSPAIRLLVRKDLRANRPVMLLMTVGGLVALALMVSGRVGFAVGGVLFLSANIAGGIFIGMFCIAQERKEQSSLFALSLPVSIAELGAQKLVSALIAYVGPWLVLTLASVLLALSMPRIPDGQIVYTLLVQGCALAITCSYFGLIAITRSEAVAGFGILVLNMSFSLFMVSFSQPAMRDPLSTDLIRWPGYAMATLGVELAIVVAAPLVALLLISRRREAF